MRSGGPSYQVHFGRRDPRTESKSDATSNIPASKRLPANEPVVLSGAHTLGLARCTCFRSRLYNDTSAIDGDLASTLSTVRRQPLADDLRQRVLPGIGG
ncbi:hypothetical protein GW17_00011867 [Ensete ventricosum]|uniref:Uncharacterized protein n=1 Tax=Ensete ventricosum TaxID=4639 RepID=A0A426XA13_ENSVE|nr:hypothetical protein B296_00057598 [Ensete ventricosum]RWW23871.1 hypothetical protein GW17_00011867 [Ensete ventricosum]RZS26778.1 hypothetical protein BHM03_00060172 [Ensete ventricosum]